MGGLISTVLQSDINEAGQLIQELAHTIQSGDWNSLLENDPFWRLADAARQSPKIISELCGFAESLLSESVSTATFLVKLLFPSLNGARTRLIVEILKLPLVYSILRLESFWMLVLHRKSFSEFFKENVYFSDLPAQLLALLHILRNPLFQKVAHDLGSEPSLIIQSFIADARKFTAMLRTYGSPFPSTRALPHGNNESTPASGRVLGLLTWITSDAVVKMLNDESLPTVLSLESAIKSLVSFRECMLEIESARIRYRKGALSSEQLVGVRYGQGTASFANEYSLLGSFCSEICRSLLKLLSSPNIIALLDFLKKHTPAVQGALLQLQEVFLAAMLVPRTSISNPYGVKIWTQCIADAWESSERMDPHEYLKKSVSHDTLGERVANSEFNTEVKAQYAGHSMGKSKDNSNLSLIQPIPVSRLWVIQATIVFWLARWQLNDSKSLDRVVSELLNREFWVELLSNFRSGCDELVSLLQIKGNMNESEATNSLSFLEATIKALSGERVRKLTHIMHRSAQTAIRAAEEAVQMLGSLASHSKFESNAFIDGCLSLRQTLHSKGIDLTQTETIQEGLVALKMVLPEEEFEQFLLNVMIPSLLQPIEKSLGGPATVSSIMGTYLSVGYSDNSVDKVNNNSKSRQSTKKISSPINCLWNKVSGIFKDKEKSELTSVSTETTEYLLKEDVITILSTYVNESLNNRKEDGKEHDQLFKEPRLQHLLKLSDYTVRSFELNEDLFSSVRTLLATLSSEVRVPSTLSTENEVVQKFLNDQYLDVNIHDKGNKEDVYNDAHASGLNSLLLQDGLVTSSVIVGNCINISIAELCSKWLLEPEVIAPLVAGQILSFCENEILQSEKDNNSIALHFALSDLLIRIANSHRLCKLISLGKDRYLPKIDAFWGTICSESFAELLEGLFPMARMDGNSDVALGPSTDGVQSRQFEKRRKDKCLENMKDSPLSEDAILASAVASPSLPSSLLDLSPGLVVRFFSVLNSTSDMVDEILSPEFVQTLLELPLLHYAALAWTRGPTLDQEKFSMFDALTFSESQFFRVLALITLSCHEANEQYVTERNTKSSSSRVYHEFVGFFKMLLEKKRLISLSTLAYPSIFDKKDGFQGEPFLDSDWNIVKDIFVNPGSISSKISDQEGRSISYQVAKLRSLDVGNLLHSCPRLSALVLSTSIMRTLAPERECLQGMSVKSKINVSESSGFACLREHNIEPGSRDNYSGGLPTKNRVTALISLLRSLRFRFLASLFRTIALDSRVFTKLLVYFGDHSNVDSLSNLNELRPGRNVKLKNIMMEIPISKKLICVLQLTRTKLLEIASAFLGLTVTLHLTQYRDIQEKANPVAIPHPFTLSEWPLQFANEFKNQHLLSKAPLIFGEFDTVISESRHLERFIHNRIFDTPPMRPLVISDSSPLLAFTPLQNIDSQLNRSLTLRYLTERSSIGTNHTRVTSLDIGRRLEYNVAATDACLLVTLLLTSHPLVFISLREDSPIWAPLVDDKFYKKVRIILNESRNFPTSISSETQRDESDTFIHNSKEKNVISGIGSRASKLAASTAKYTMTSLRDQFTKNDNSRNSSDKDDHTSLSLRSAPTMFMLMIRFLQIASLSSVRNVMRDVSSEDSVWPHLIADIIRILHTLTQVPVECNKTFVPSEITSMLILQTGRSHSEVSSALDVTFGSILHWLIERSYEKDTMPPSGVMRKIVTPDQALSLVVRVLRICRAITDRPTNQNSLLSGFFCYPIAWTTILNPYSLARIAAGSSLEVLRSKIPLPATLNEAQPGTSLLDRLLRSQVETPSSSLGQRINRRLTNVMEKMRVRGANPSLSPSLYSHPSRKISDNLMKDAHRDPSVQSTVSDSSYSTSEGQRNTSNEPSFTFLDTNRGKPDLNFRERLFSLANAVFGHVTLDEAFEELEVNIKQQSRVSASPQHALQKEFEGNITLQSQL